MSAPSNWTDLECPKCGRIVDPKTYAVHQLTCGLDFQPEKASGPIQTKRPLVIIESPFAGDVETHIAYAKRAVRDCLLRGEAPIASHLLFTQPGLLDDNVPEQRRAGIEAGWAWYGVAGVSCAVYADYGTSRGMAGGIDVAIALGRAVWVRRIGRNEDAA